MRGDVMAGITVGVMLIPQGMAYAVLAGVPPIYGLYAVLLPLLVYPVFGTSRHLSIGVVAIDMLIISAGVGAIAESGTNQYVGLVILLAALVGATQIAMSVARLGFIINILSRPVVVGFTTAAPIIIAFSQLGNLMGVDIPQTQFIFVIISNVIEQIGQANLLTMIVGLAGILLLWSVRKWYPLFPESLLLVVASTIAVWGLNLHQQGVEIVGSVPSGLPTPQLPSLNLGETRRLLSTVITLSLVQFIYIVSVARVFAQRHNYTIHPNRELMAIGAANLFGSMLRGMPVSGSFSRSAVAEQAGSRTSLTNIFAAGVVMLTLLFFTPLFYYLPQPALGAIIVVAAIGLIDLDEIKYLFETKQRDGWIAIFTFVVTLLVGIQEGILLGIGASLIAVLLRASRPHVAVLGYVAGSRSFRDITRFPEAEQIEGILVLRVEASFSFTNAEYFKDFIIEQSEEEDRHLHSVVIDGMSINDLDTTAVDALKTVLESLEDMGIDIYMTGLKGPVRDVMYRSGLADMVGVDHFYMSPHRAVMHILSSRGGEEKLEQDLQAYRKSSS
jgi:SulP family sulfate permease